ncbi:hypothetical protein J6590_033562 [Homalodisca vitripennis]|nr:hypothetical protein J6590_033562 [Homalodisca vitripennis]
MLTAPQLTAHSATDLVECSQRQHNRINNRIHAHSATAHSATGHSATHLAGVLTAPQLIVPQLTAPHICCGAVSCGAMSCGAMRPHLWLIYNSVKMKCKSVNKLHRCAFPPEREGRWIQIGETKLMPKWKLTGCAVKDDSSTGILTNFRDTENSREPKYHCSDWWSQP